MATDSRHTQGLIGSICLHDGAYWFFYADRDTDGKGYLFARKAPNLIQIDQRRTRWSAATRIAGPLPAQLIIRVAKSRDGSRWAVLYNGYRAGSNGWRQDLFLQYTADLSITGPNGLSGLRWFDTGNERGLDNTSYVGLDSGGGIYAQHCFATDASGRLAVTEQDDAHPEVGGMLTWADFSRGIYHNQVFWAKWQVRPASSMGSRGRNLDSSPSQASSKETVIAPAISPGAKPSAKASEDSRYVEARNRMVKEDLRGRDIRDAEVLAVMGRTPRQRFVPEGFLDVAYADQPLPIGHGQTISQPYILALMTQAARPKPTSRGLDIGTGSGYQAAVLAQLCKEVCSIEILKPLADSARSRLMALGYKNITVRVGDGYRGWPEKAPFDVIIVAAAPDHVPQPLIDQLAPGGRLVIPVGGWFQELLVIEKQKDGTVDRQSIAPVTFVPMRGEAENARGK